MAGGIGIQEDDESLGEATELSEVFFGDRGALSGNDARDADGVAADGIELPFNQNEGVFAFAISAGKVEVEDRARFFEKFGLG